MPLLSSVVTFNAENAPLGVRSDNVTSGNTKDRPSWNAGTITACVVGTGVALVLIIMLVLLLFRKRRQHAQLLDVMDAGSHPGHGGNNVRSVVIDPFPSIRQFRRTSSSQRLDTDSNTTFEKESLDNDIQHQVDLILLPIPLPMNPKHRRSQSSGISSSTASLPPTQGLSSPKRAVLRIADARDTSPTPNSNSNASSSRTTIETLGAPLLRAAQVSTGVPVSRSASLSSSPPTRPEDRVVGAVQDEDSGIRLIQEGHTGGFVEVLPPLYTVH